MGKIHYWLWGIAERMDWDRRWPRSFWRWLLKREDRRHGWFHSDEDYVEADD